MYEKSFEIIRTYAKQHSLDMFWIERYIRFISNCYVHYKELLSQNCNWHHVVPRTWNGSNNHCNLIKLPIKAHMIAHQILDRVGDESMHIAFRNGFLNVCAISKFNYVPTMRLIESILKDRHSTGVAIVNLTTHEDFPSYQAAEKAYNIPKGYLIRFKNGDMIAGCYWQTKELVDKNGIDFELERIKKHKQEIRSTPVNRVRKNISKTRVIVCLDDNIEYANNEELAKVANIAQPYNILTSIKTLTLIRGKRYQFKDIVEQYGLQYCINQYEEKQQFQEKAKTTRFKKVADLTNKVIYDDIYKASELTGIKKDTLASSILSKSKSRTTKCYYAYYNDGDDLDKMLQDILDFHDANTETQSKRASRPVYKLSTKEWYPSTVAAVEALGLKDRSGIAGAISKANKIKGSYWQYAEIVDQIGFEQAINDQEARHEMLKQRKKMKTE